MIARAWMTAGMLAVALCEALIAAEPVAPYPPSGFSIALEGSTLETRCAGNDNAAPGSDNWTATWAANGRQYMVWGDGAGFDFSGSPDDEKCKLGVAQIEGDFGAEICTDVFEQGNHQSTCPGGTEFTGKSASIVSVNGGQLYMFVSAKNVGNTSGANGFHKTTLMKSLDEGLTWADAGDVEWDFNDLDFYRACDDPHASNLHTDCDADAPHPFHTLSFVQYGRDNRASPDDFLYAYAPGRTKTRQGNDEWEVQNPGVLYLMRAPENDLDTRSSWQFLSSFDPRQKTSANNPAWSSDFRQATPVWRDTANGVMRVSAVWSPRFDRIFLIAQSVDRHRNPSSHVPDNEDAYFAMFTAPKPWRLDAWETVSFTPAVDVGGVVLNYGGKTVIWSISPKWLDWGKSGSQANEVDFVLIGTMPDEDEFGLIQGTLRSTSAVGSGRETLPANAAKSR